MVEKTCRCGAPLTISTRGRPKTYCGAKCRLRAQIERQTLQRSLERCEATAFKLRDCVRRNDRMLWMTSGGFEPPQAYLRNVEQTIALLRSELGRAR